MFKNQSNNLSNNAIPSTDTHNDSLFDLPPNSNLPANSWHYPIRYLNRLLPFNGYHKTNKSSKTIKADKKSSVDSERHATMANPSKIASSKLDSFNTLTQKFSTQYFKRLTQTSITSQSLLFGLMDICQQFTTAAITNSPATLMADQLQLYQQQMQLLKNSLMTAIGAEKEPLVQPEKGDKRFNDKAWSDRVFFNHIKQSYLLSANSILNTIETTEGIDNKTRQRLSFFTRQWLNAIAPSNFLLTNPEVLRITKENKGKNLLRGLKQLAEDLEKSAHLLTIRMTDDNAFMLGENIAATPGKVVYRNRMFELIQYTPTTELVNKRPLLIVPPWINKFYIVDLKEKNSYIRWALNEGHSVFIISWVNPDRSYKQAGMETYMHEGLLTALTVIEDITGEPDANVIGYCIGGMLLALTLSWLAENNQSQSIASATFWTTMFDFSDPGDLGVFIDENIVNALEQEGEKKGVFDGRLMGIAFSLLRENSLYWNYYIQNYLKGERPIPFDLLYWNSDCTNVTAALHRFVLRELYLGNKLIQKGGLQFDNINIDLSKVTTPTYVVAALQDHIVKWKGSYQSTQVLGGNVTFVLAESGHVAGIINPPTGKYGFYTHDLNVSDPEQWFDLAQKQDRSWWLHWREWISNYSEGKVPARQPGKDTKGNELPVLCDAPGEYVRIKAAEALA
ncbi:class I poly(R)-hydroxyalkanoic acid synthase [Psychrobacter sanguinis]|uniref:class I poly(R)-hydroxyalkanoic acid synthase n=1 Tax=Psychrobacter sanguinis TaxID=861445 RepID=UPI0019192FE8|nr:class I poly(R)-hydroxyalkanoic acid synthase [Psychrobacter sanguinis]MCC3344481.1 class I poly(R)-hydroxyalkanoic acid synthase [Psychrobacter sanguinis]